MGITIGLAVAQLLHQPGRRVAQVQRRFQRRLSGHILARGIVGLVHRIALGRTGQIDNGLGNRQLALGTAEPLLHIPGIQAQGQGPGIGIADVLAGHAHYPTSTCTPQASGHRLRARASALPTAALAMRTTRLAMYSGSQPPSSMRAYQYRAPSGLEPRTDLCSADIWS